MKVLRKWKKSSEKSVSNTSPEKKAFEDLSNCEIRACNLYACNFFKKKQLFSTSDIS